ncbi:MAG: T9SS type A sorting domain-containing protein, partial [Bacteroidales bacterium]|nr:T9SS type A sorting domain-containing protein [Bacteroidales bacterium]
YYTKINGNLYGNGQSLSDDELTIIQEQPYISNESIRYPKCAVDEYENVHSIYEKGEYGCNTPKSVYYKKMNSVPLLKIECPDDSVIFVEMTGAGTQWQGTFTPPEYGTYNIRVSGSDIDGNTGVDFYQFEHINTNIQENELSEFLINYPNPFDSETTIEFNLTKPCNVKLKIYCINGKLVKTLYSGALQSGIHIFTWNATNNNNNTVPNGIYFYKLERDNHNKIGKIVFLK